MKSSKEITTITTPGRRRKNVPKRIPDVPAELQKQVRDVKTPYVPAEVKEAAEKHGIDLDYLIEKIKEQAEATMVVEEPLQVPLKDEMDEPITMTQMVNGKEVEVPLVTTKKQYNPDTGKIEVVTILRTIPNLRARQWAIDTLAKLLVAPMSKETNINVTNMTKDRVSRIEDASEYLKSKPKLREELLRMVRDENFEDIIEADFEEVSSEST